MKSKLASFNLSRLAILPLLLLGLGGCDQLSGAMGVETSARKAAKLEAEGKAVGGGCRQSGRAIEDCYSIYTWVPKEAVFSGWLDMDAYMRENNLETIPPLLPPPPPDSAKKRKRSTGEGAESSNDMNESASGAAETPAPLAEPIDITSQP